MLLVICPAKFSLALLPLKEHKERTGILTTIVTLEDIYRNYSSGDEAEKVKRCIADSQRSAGTRFVMLVGDSDTFPVRFPTERIKMPAIQRSTQPICTMPLCTKRTGPSMTGMPIGTDITAS